MQDMLFLGVYITPEGTNLLEYIEPVRYVCYEFLRIDTLRLKNYIDEALKNFSLSSNPNTLDREIRDILGEKKIEYYIFNLERYHDELAKALSPYNPF